MTMNECFILRLYLGKVLLCNSASPLAAEVERPGGITDISTLDQHSLDYSSVNGAHIAIITAWITN